MTSTIEQDPYQSITVAKLIEELQKCPPDYEVVAGYDCFCITGIYGIEGQDDERRKVKLAGD